MDLETDTKFSLEYEDLGEKFRSNGLAADATLWWWPLCIGHTTLLKICPYGKAKSEKGWHCAFISAIFFFFFFFCRQKSSRFFFFCFFLLFILSRDKTWRYLAKNTESIRYPFTRGLHEIRSTHFCLYWDVLCFQNELLLKVLSNLKRFCLTLITE